MAQYILPKGQKEMPYTMQSHYKMVWRVRLLCPKYYASRLALKHGGRNFRAEIIGDIPNVGLSTYLDYNHYWIGVGHWMAVDISVTTSMVDFKTILRRATQVLYDDSIPLRVPVVVQEEIFYNIMSKKNIQFWKNELRTTFEIKPNPLPHREGFYNFVNFPKLAEIGVPCVEKLFVVSTEGHRQNVADCIADIGNECQTYIMSLPNSYYQYPRRYPFWFLKKDEKTIQTYIGGRTNKTITRMSIWSAPKVQTSDGTCKNGNIGPHTIASGTNIQQVNFCLTDNMVLQKTKPTSVFEIEQESSKKEIAPDAPKNEPSNNKNLRKCKSIMELRQLPSKIPVPIGKAFNGLTSGTTAKQASSLFQGSICKSSLRYHSCISLNK